MAMNGNARGDADYNALTALNPNMSKLSPTETSNLKHAFEVLFTADTGYITANADVLPTAPSGPNLEASAGITGDVLTGAGAGGTTATNELAPLTGMGSVQ